MDDVNLQDLFEAYENRTNINLDWENIFDEAEESDHIPPELPISDDEKLSMFVDEDEFETGRILVYGSGESEDDDVAEYDVSAPDMDSSDEEFQIAVQRVKEYKAEIEKDHQGHLSEYEDSDDDMQINSGNEDESTTMSRRRKEMAITEKTDCKSLNWKVGLRFPNIKMFKEAAKRYGILNGFTLSFGLCNKIKRKIAVSCKKDCKFRVYASWHEKEGCLLVKTVHKEHTCSRDMLRNRQLTSTWMAKEYLSRCKANPQWKANDMVDSVRRRYGVIIQTWVAYKAKAAALKLLHGSMKDHYSKIGRYMEELKRCDNGGTFELVTIPSNPPIFQRLFICFQGLLLGFLSGCRRFICLDGCFLKTFLGGILLCAIGRDGNNQMFPICWAVVEGENRDSWEWFLNHLKCVLNGTDGKGWTFMSDQCKGLLAASNSVFPKCEHRNCARHIYANWKKMHKGDELKMNFWKAVRAFTEVDFEEVVEEIKLLSPKAADDFLKQNPKVFCKAFFSRVSQCDVVVNNMAETFNGYILKARSKHIIDMLEHIRNLLMDRIFIKKDLMEGCDVETICPRIKLKFEEEKVKAWQLSVTAPSVSVFQVREMVDAFIVDVHNRSCTCRKWDITGIPCHHAIACLEFLKLKAEIYIHDCYKRKTYLRAYEGHITPSPSERFWPKKNFPLHPPPIKIQPGRPKKNRRKDLHEDPKKAGKLTKHGVQMRCSKCKSLGHNMRSCVKESELHPTTKKTRGRPRKHQMTSGQRDDGSQGEALHINERGITNGRGRGRRGKSLDTRGVGIIYRKSGDIIYKSSAGHVYFKAHELITAAQPSQQGNHTSQ